LELKIEFFQAEPIAHKLFLNVDDQAWHPGNVLEPCAAHTVFGFGVSDFSAHGWQFVPWQTDLNDYDSPIS
jgi:hypothetical protein